MRARNTGNKKEKNETGEKERTRRIAKDQYHGSEVKRET